MRMHTQPDKMKKIIHGAPLYCLLRSQRAFTLIELLVAILLFAIGIVGVTRMQIEGVKGNSHSMQLTQAVSEAEDLAEYLRALRVDSSGDPPVWPGDLTVGNHVGTSTPYQGITYTTSWEVHQLQPRLGSGVAERLVVVQVDWVSSGNHSLTFSFTRGFVF